MGKFDRLTILKKTKARVARLCSNCDANILPGEDYFKEHIQDRHLHRLYAKAFCLDCFKEHGEALLKKDS
jgi:hypothetical protein